MIPRIMAIIIRKMTKTKQSKITRVIEIRSKKKKKRVLNIEIVVNTINSIKEY